MLRARLGVASAFVDWTYVIGGPNESWMSAQGTRKVLLAWEPVGIRFSDVLNLRQDRYLEAVARSMRAFPYDVYVRPWPEMNASWSTWQPTSGGAKPDGGTPEQFIAAWRYLVTFMRSRGAAHLKFVFSTDAGGGPRRTPIEAIWPGSAYVDVLGMDGYNWGNSAGEAGESWRSFDTIFTPMYRTLTSLDLTAPVWITELGCKEPAEEDDWGFPRSSSPVDPAHSKATWIDEMMSSTAFPRVEALVYFEQRKERDWRLESSGAALTAVRRLLISARPPTG
jgi:beta-mannanase